MSKKKSGAKPKLVEQKTDKSRRNFVLLGAGALAAAGAGLAGAYRAGWLDSRTASPAPAIDPAGSAGQRALSVVNEMLERYARELNNPSVLIHAVRGFGRNFKTANGASAVDQLCSLYAADKEVNGKRYVYFKRSAEVHENSFLKAFLEAGVSLDQPVIAGGNRYVLRDVAESGKALFRFDPKDVFKYDDNQYRYDPTFFPPVQPAPGRPGNDLRGEMVHEHLPWGLIAFSNLMTPDKAVWTNAYGETIKLPEVIDSGLAEYENTCALGRQEMSQGRAAPKVFRDAIKKYSCFGLHSIYSFLVCVRRGYTSNDAAERVRQAMDLVTYRLKSDAEATNREYAQEAQGAPPQIVEAFRTRALIKLYGHAFEAINYAKLHQLMTFSPGQERRIEAGEQAFYESVLKLQSLDYGMLRSSLGDKFLSDVAIALGHAARAMKLLTPQNPDVLA